MKYREPREALRGLPEPEEREPWWAVIPIVILIVGIFIAFALLLLCRGPR
jgi:hypothetical protein